MRLLWRAGVHQGAQSGPVWQTGPPLTASLAQAPSRLAWLVLDIDGIRFPPLVRLKAVCWRFGRWVVQVK
jgi:hypothetical protein